MSWDNPFPTFPSSKTRNKLTGNEDFNRSRGGISLGQTSWAGVPEESRPSNGDGQLRHDPPRIGKTSNLQEGAPDRTYMRGAQSSLETQQAMMDPMQWVSGNLQSTQRPLNQPMHPSNRLRPQMDYGRRSEDTARGPSFRRLAVNQMVDQRSRTMPATVTDTFAGPNSRETYGQQLIAQDVRHNLTGHHEWSPLYDESPRPPMQSHSGSIEALPDSGCVNREPQALHPQSYHSQQASIGEVFDAYYHSPHHSQSSLMQGYADPVRTPHEEDMPNFDSLSGPGASHKQGMTVDDHLHSQQPTPALPSIPAYPPLGVSSGPQPLSSRSKSSPNLQQQSSQGSQKYSDGFDFELPGSVPAMYAARPQTERDTNALVEYGEEAAQSKYSEREQNNAINWSQGSARHQEPSNRPDTGESHGRLGQSRSPDRRNQPPTSKPFPPYEHQSGRARNGPSPANRMVPSSPPTGQSPNPDALPAHPTPIRPGLMTNAPLKQSPRPRPVRQYTSETAPRTESPSSPQPQICRAPRDETKSVFVTHEGLERLRQMTRSNPSDSKIQLLLARKLVEAASVLADEGGRADPRTVSRNRERVISEAYKVVRKLAQNGYLDAMFYLGDCYSRGFLGLHTDPKEAFGHYQSAAKAGHAQAAYRVAVCCEMGLDEGGGTKRDAVKAMQWYQRAATLGDTPAMYKLGVIQLKGLLGQPKNASAALTWLQRAAEQADKENPHALHELVSHACLQVLAYLAIDVCRLFFTKHPTASKAFVKMKRTRSSSSSNPQILATNSHNSALDAHSSMASYELPLILDRASPGIARQQCRTSIRVSSHSVDGTLPDPKGYYSKATRKHTFGHGKPLRQVWRKQSMQWAISPRLALELLQILRMRSGGTGDQPVSIGGTFNVFMTLTSTAQNFPQARARLEDLRRGGAKMQKTRVSRSKMNKQPEGECIVM